MRLYHPNLKPPANEYETESDDPDHLKVYFDMGWKEAPDPVDVGPHAAPEPVEYAPVEKPAAKVTKATKASKATDK